VTAADRDPQHTTPIRVLVVEDEPLAQRALLDELARMSNVVVVGAAADGPSASAMLEVHDVDVVLMDIQLPGYSGMEVLTRCAHPPAVIFITAHGEHATHAFELAAIDYVLKPFDSSRIHQAVERAREQVFLRRRGDDYAESTRARVRAVLHEEPLHTVFVRDGARIVALRIQDIVRLEADDIYVAIHSQGRRFLVHMPLFELERRLPEGMFLRVHRSHVVNQRHIQQFIPYDGSRLQVQLRDGSTVLASRSHSKRIREQAL
jgi:two-component system LytT family response regulator